jgi:hypothetical protein
MKGMACDQHPWLFSLRYLKIKKLKYIELHGIILPLVAYGYET